MSSNKFNLQKSFDEIYDLDLIDECVSINKLSIEWVQKNPLLTNKGKVFEKDIHTFRENKANLNRPSDINDEIRNFQFDFSSSNSECNESSCLCKNSSSDAWESLKNVFWVKVNNINRKPRSFKFCNEMSSKEILKELQLF